jgi:hypothetical protein
VLWKASRLMNGYRILRLSPERNREDTYRVQELDQNRVDLYISQQAKLCNSIRTY